MTDYQKYINALRKCAKEHENDRTSFGHIIVSDLCRDTANLLETEQITDLKEAYNKGYKDGREALAVHLELCKDEGSIIIVPDGATNGDMIKTMFPDAEVIAVENEEMEIVEYVVKIDVETAFTAEWWNAPYGEKEPTVEQGLSYADESGLQSAT